AKDVMRMRSWIALHFPLFLGIGILGVGARRGIALPPGGHFSAIEQWLICSAASAIVLVIMGIAATSERHIGSRRFPIWTVQLAIAAFVLISAPLASRIPAAALLFG